MIKFQLSVTQCAEAGELLCLVQGFEREILGSVDFVSDI